MARIGARLTQQIASGPGTLITPYLKMNYLQGIGGGDHAEIGGVVFGTGGYGQAFQVGGGATGTLGKSFSGVRRSMWRGRPTVRQRRLRRMVVQRMACATSSEGARFCNFRRRSSDATFCARRDMRLFEPLGTLGMGIEVLKAAARLDDADGIEPISPASVPRGEGLRPMLQPGRKHRLEQYDKETSTARYLLVDGAWFVCFVVTGISLEDARAIARQTNPMVEWSTLNFHRGGRARAERDVPRPRRKIGTSPSADRAHAVDGPPATHWGSGMVAEANGLAAAILIAHLAVIAFNLLGLIAIPLGALLGWRFVRVRWWRLVHLGLLAVVALQALAGRACILTILHDELTGGGHRPEPLIMAFVNRMIFWPLPLWAFTAIYVVVWLYVLALWWIVPPTARTSSFK